MALLPLDALTYSRGGFMKRRIVIGLAACTLAIAATAHADADSSAVARPARHAARPTARISAAGPQVAVLETVLGTIAIKFHPADAPRTVANFKKLVRDKFYDGTYFHRVIPGFIIQGGDPNTKKADPSEEGSGGPGYTGPAGIKGKHVRGAV